MSLSSHQVPKFQSTPALLVADVKELSKIELKVEINDISYQLYCDTKNYAKSKVTKVLKYTNGITHEKSIEESDAKALSILVNQLTVTQFIIFCKTINIHSFHNLHYLEFENEKQYGRCITHYFPDLINKKRIYLAYLSCDTREIQNALDEAIFDGNLNEQEAQELLHMRNSQALLEKLFEAIRKKDLFKTKELIAQEPHLINELDISGHSPLMIAAALGHIDIVDFFLRHPNCDVNLTDRYVHNSALMIAVAFAHYDVVMALLETRKCELEAKNLIGHTALDLAMYRGDELMSRKLMAYGSPFVSPEKDLCGFGFIIICVAIQKTLTFITFGEINLLAREFEFAPIDPKLTDILERFSRALLMYQAFSYGRVPQEMLTDEYLQNDEESADENSTVLFNRSIKFYKKLSAQQKINLKHPLIIQYQKEHLLSRAEASALSAAELCALEHFHALDIRSKEKLAPSDVLALTPEQRVFFEIVFDRSLSQREESKAIKDATKESKIDFRFEFNKIKNYPQNSSEIMLQTIDAILSLNSDKFSNTKQNMHHLTPKAYCNKLKKLILDTKPSHEKIKNIYNELHFLTTGSYLGFGILKEIFNALPNPDAMLHLFQQMKNEGVKETKLLSLK